MNINRAGRGVATLMNLSPLWYKAYRTEGFEAAKRRDAFLKHLNPDARRWVEIEGAGEAEFGYDITCFRKPDGRKILFVSGNPEIVGTEAGGGNASRLKTDAIEIMLKFKTPIRNARDERRGASLGEGLRFKFLWRQNEAVVVSFK